MATNKALHRLATNPQAFMRFQMTGKVPAGTRPSSPLITLLRAIGPRDLSRIGGVTIDSRLGYVGSHQFHFGAQALRWVAPSEEVFGSFPAEACRDKRFNRQLYIEDLAECCTDFSPQLFELHRSLCRPRTPSSLRPETLP